MDTTTSLNNYDESVFGDAMLRPFVLLPEGQTGVGEQMWVKEV